MYLHIVTLWIVIKLSDLLTLDCVSLQTIEELHGIINGSEWLVGYYTSEFIVHFKVKVIIIDVLFKKLTTEFIFMHECTQ